MVTFIISYIHVTKKVARERKSMRKPTYEKMEKEAHKNLKNRLLGIADELNENPANGVDKLIELVNDAFLAGKEVGKEITRWNYRDYGKIGTGPWG